MPSLVGGAKGVAEPEGGSAPTASPEEVPSPQPESSAETAQSIAQRLDALMLQTAKLTTRPVEQKELQSLLSSLPQDYQKAITNAVRAAKDSLKAISRFSGSEIASAMVEQGGKTGAILVWKGYDPDAKTISDPVANAINKAIEAQGTLSYILKGTMQLPELSDAACNTLMDLAFKCDRRQSEISALTMQLADVALKSGDDPEVKKLLSKDLASLLPRQALEMHGTAGAIERLKKELQPLAKSIEELSARPNDSVTYEQLQTYTLAVDTAAKALDDAARRGVKLTEDGSERVKPDMEFLATASKLVNYAKQKLADLSRTVGDAMLTHFADTVFGTPPDIPLSRSNLNRIYRFAPTLAQALSVRGELHAAALAYVENPTNGNRFKLERLSNRYLDIDQASLNEELKKDSTAASIFRPHDWKRMSEDFKQLSGIRSQVSHFVRMVRYVKSKLGPEEFLSTTSARALLEGRLEFATLVEARVHGMSDSDVDPALDDSRLVSAKPLGGGGVNAVSLMTYSDGSQYVFKPEAPGRQVMEGFALSKDYAEEEQIAHLNLATQDAVDALGAHDVSVKCSVGAHNGDYGLFMEKAPGVEAKAFVNGGAVPPGSLTIAQVKALPPAQYAQVVGGIMRGINRLEWLDLITGQGDRHYGNYMIDVHDDLSVSVKGIDNDMCYPAYRTGLRTYVLKGRGAATFELAVDVTVGNYEERHRRAVGRRMVTDPGVKLGSDDGTITLDTTKFQAGELYYATYRTIGAHGATLPDYIDEDFCQHLLALKDGDARDKYLAAIAKRLPPEAVDAARSRLDEAIALAETLQREKKVVTAEDFAKRSVQKELLMRDLTTKNPVQPVDDEVLPADNAVMLVAMSQVKSMFARDVLTAIDRGGWFK
jgi:hypothetical protein